MLLLSKNGFLNGEQLVEEAGAGGQTFSSGGGESGHQWGVPYRVDNGVDLLLPPSPLDERARVCDAVDVSTVKNNI